MNAPASPPFAPLHLQPLPAGELLRVWECGNGAQPVEQALYLLESACPGVGRATIASLTIGQRDAYLLELRELLFGPDLSCLTDCPACGDRLEMNLRTHELRLEPDVQPKFPFIVRHADMELSVRPPTSADLLALPRGLSVAQMRDVLFARCIAGNAGIVPPEAMEAVIEAMSSADRQADVKLELACPSCGVRWKSAFDIVTYLWSELNQRAVHLLREVHLLASGYGWSEAEILSLSSRRRQSYLEMLSGWATS